MQVPFAPKLKDLAAKGVFELLKPFPAMLHEQGGIGARG